MVVQTLPQISYVIKFLVFTFKMPQFDSWRYHMAYSLCSPLNSYIHNPNSMLGSQILFQNNFIVQANFCIGLPDKKKVYMRTCHSTFIFERCSSLFLNQVFFIVRFKARRKSKMDLPSTFTPYAKPLNVCS